MIGMIELATHADATFGSSSASSARDGDRLAVGVAGGLVERQLLRRVALPAGALPAAHARASPASSTASPPSRTARASSPSSSPGSSSATPRRPQARRWTLPVGARDLGELVVFVALGLTVDLGYISAAPLGGGLVLAVFLGSSSGRSWSRRCSCRRGSATASGSSSSGAASRAPCRSCSPRSRSARTPERDQIYGIVFVVVLLSVVVQGALVPATPARRRGDRPGAR